MTGPITPLEPGEPDRPPWADARPLSGATLEELADNIAAGATVVGFGESTRSSRETFEVRDQLFRRLVRHHGFRALAIQDSADVATELDRYVRRGAGSAESALARAWRPWRTAEMAATLRWIRAFNHEHPNDGVRIFGLKARHAQPADYDAILDFVRRAAPELLEEVASHLEPIRTAHEVDEHVQRAREMHPGRPFVDHARDALALIQSLPDIDAADDVLTRMRLIVDFHQRSVAGRGTYAGEAAVWADVIGDYEQRSGLRVAYWDSIAHTSAAPATLGLAPDHGPQLTVGTVLRSRYGKRYASVAIGFHHGDLGVATVPEPAPDLIDAMLGEVDLPAHWNDLRTCAAGGGWDGPAKARVISGVYERSRDAAEHMSVASLTGAFDVLIHIRQISPVRPLQ